MNKPLFPELQSALTGVCEKLGIKIDTNLQQEYQNGKYPSLLSYEKVENSSINIPTIQKYLIGAQTILNQPCQFYDINRACRHFFLIRVLSKAIDSNIKYVSNYEPVFEKLLKETKYDPFEATLYELAVSGVYAEKSGIENVTFLKSQTGKAPEFNFQHHNKQIFVECKKFNRDSDIVSKVRNEVRQKTQLTLHSFKEINQSALLEVSFHKDPESIPNTLIRDMSHEAFKNKVTIVDKALTVSASPLIHQELEEYTLYPSPKYFWNRYGFRNHGEWFGLTSLFEAKYGSIVDPEFNHEQLASTWLDNMAFECVLKWKITDEDILWRYRKLGYNLLFKGLKQLKSQGDNSILHAWYERDGFAGHRRKELLHFFHKLEESKKDIFSWIIFNETILDTSVKGIFDLIEHVHPISGNTACTKEPLITSIFTHNQEFVSNNGVFGAGPELPDIDEVYEEK